MAIYRAMMLRWGNDHDIREIEVPDAEVVEDIKDLLEVIFHYGQNNLQPRKFPSLCAGDVVEIGEQFWLCLSAGWRELSLDELKNYRQLSHDEKWDVYFAFEEES
jgi:hypothetical protein